MNAAVDVPGLYDIPGHGAGNRVGHATRLGILRDLLRHQLPLDPQPLGELRVLGGGPGQHRGQRLDLGRVGRGAPSGLQGGGVLLGGPAAPGERVLDDVVQPRDGLGGQRGGDGPQDRVGNLRLPACATLLINGSA